MELVTNEALFRTHGLVYQNIIVPVYKASLQIVKIVVKHSVSCSNAIRTF
jgi:hypothetical protein